MNDKGGDGVRTAQELVALALGVFFVYVEQLVPIFCTVE